MVQLLVSMFWLAGSVVIEAIGHMSNLELEAVKLVLVPFVLLPVALPGRHGLGGRRHKSSVLRAAARRA